MPRSSALVIVALLGCLGTGSVAMADSQPAQNNDCVDEIAAASIRHGVPAALLYAVAVTESGRVHHNGQIRPWAFAVNVSGGSHQFDSAEDAVAAVRRAQARREKSIDVGCLQINLQHHPNAFSSLETSFDPRANVEYGTQYLSNLYKKFGNWTSAVAFYHSATPYHQWEYVCRVHARLVQYGLAPAGECAKLRQVMNQTSFRP